MRNSMSMVRSVVLTIMALALVLGGAGRAKAEFIITFAQDGVNVVATGAGSLNTSDLATVTTATSGNAEVQPYAGFIDLGPFGANVTVLRGFTGPGSFGPGAPAIANMTLGDSVSLDPSSNELEVPESYVSGHSLSDSATWDNTTISRLGLTPGTYTWTWGSGSTADSLEVVIPSASVTPEPSTLTLLSVGAGSLIGYAGLCRKRRRQAACSA